MTFHFEKRPRTPRLRKHRFIVAATLLPVAMLGIYFAIKSPSPTTITNETIEDIGTYAKISSSLPNEQPRLEKLQASARHNLKVVSEEIPISQRSTNAVALEWKQDGEEGIDLQVRTKRDGTWTQWIDALQNEDRKDGDDASTEASTLILANEIEDFQYRFSLRGSAENPSGVLDLSQAKLRAINSNAGPKKLGDNKSFLGKIGDALRPSQSAHALADGPRIISRAEWGSPEPNGSPRWQPEYYTLGRAIVHHTVSTETPNAMVAVRAIWDYHANGRGWGDIGYNYLVDSAGNIFQGRYFDTNYATRNSVEVEAGHTLGHNKGTIGIAAIGNFQTSLVPTPTLNAISNLIAFRFAPYNLNPVGNGPFNGPTIIGHRDHGSTACPGTNLYNQLPNIRVWTAEKAPRYAQMHRLDNSFVGQQLYLNGNPVSSTTVLNPGDNAEISFNIKNNGLETWKNTGSGVVRLGNYRGRTSLLQHPDWLLPDRPTSFTGKVVKNGNSTTVEAASEIAYGEVAQFRYPIKIPTLASASGNGVQTIGDYLGLVIDGRAWFLRDMGLHYPVRVATRSYSWQHQGQAIYTDASKQTAVNSQNLHAGSRYYVVVSAKNNGTGTWQRTNTRLGTANPIDRSSALYDSTWPGRNRVAALQQATVAPGASGTFEFWITTPSSGFASKEYFRPVVDGVTWMNDLGLYLPIRVIN